MQNTYGQLIPPARLRDVWDKVKAGLAIMPADDWIAEDVYHEVRSGKAALYMFGDGFLVLQKSETQYSNLPVLHVWLAYNAEGQDVYADGMGLIQHLAAQMGAHKITFGSPRKGWAKRFPLITATYEIPRAG